jgi:acetylornithine deacetylase/succinyl-diaminopimelate desuccinylase-like protein
MPSPPAERSPHDPRASALATALAYARANDARFVRELAEFVAIPSVSGDAAREGDVRRCAQWLANAAQRAGLERVRLVESGGAAFVRGDVQGARNRPVLVYGHYDVTPPGPLAAWRTPPFSPTLERDTLIARGSSDDKGQLFAHLKAIECLRRSPVALPLSLTCLFEGEEEIGSPALLRQLAARGRELNADVAIISDTRMRAPEIPAITYGLRGKLQAELVVRRRGGELHAGEFGGATLDAVRELARLIASLHDASGRVAVPGFFAGVRPVSPAERAYLARVSPSDAEVAAAGGIDAPVREAHASMHERTTLEPSITVVGIAGGDPDHGKSAVPSSARAILDVRLVPDQNPHALAAALLAHVRRIAPRGVHVELHVRAAARAVALDLEHPALRAAADAAHATFGRPPVFLRSGGTIPVVSALDALGVAPILLGFALSSDGLHAPNEHFALRRFRAATECSIRLLAALATAPAASSGVSRPSVRAARARRAAELPRDSRTSAAWPHVASAARDR